MEEFKLLRNKEYIIDLIQNDNVMMEIIRAASTLEIPDWWICAGFVRSKVWDTLHGFSERTSIPDVDVIYFDEVNIDESYDEKIEEQLKAVMPSIPWSVKNQARMHKVNSIPPYTSSEDAISKFPETATAIGVKLDKENKIVLTTPYGVDDLVNLQVKPTPYFTESKERISIYQKRIIKKNWKAIWPNIKITHI